MIVAEKIVGILSKMKTQLRDSAYYEIQLNDTVLELNSFINKNIALEITGNIFCIQCGRKTAKSFQQGYCFPCFQRLQECNLCLIHPERCLVESGRCDPNDWAHAHCGGQHIVYLANASSIKVGITREKNIPSRWMDQGAIQALPIFKVSNRVLAGKIEVVFKSHVADKTNWRVMLKNQVEKIDLIAMRNLLCEQAENELKILKSQYSQKIEFLNPQEIINIQYPVLQYPEKIVSLSFEKTRKIEGRLLGIKGQYFIFDTGVINIRKYGGYEITFSSFSS